VQEPMFMAFTFSWINVILGYLLLIVDQWFLWKNKNKEQ